DPGYAYPALSFVVLGAFAQLASFLYLTVLTPEPLLRAARPPCPGRRTAPPGPGRRRSPAGAPIRSRSLAAPPLIMTVDSPGGPEGCTP
ncbi:hypothetical protein ACWEQU_34490, partial [Streptomyces nodosus]